MAKPASIKVFLQNNDVVPAYTCDNHLYLPKNIKTYELFENIMNSVITVPMFKVNFIFTNQ